MSVAMFPEPIKGRVFRFNWETLDTGAAVTDVAVKALGIHEQVGWFRHHTWLLVLEETSKKLYWADKKDFKADTY